MIFRLFKQSTWRRLIKKLLIKQVDAFFKHKDTKTLSHKEISPSTKFNIFRSYSVELNKSPSVFENIKFSNQKVFLWLRVFVFKKITNGSFRLLNKLKSLLPLFFLTMQPIPNCERACERDMQVWVNQNIKKTPQEFITFLF